MRNFKRVRTLAASLALMGGGAAFGQQGEHHQPGIATLRGVIPGYISVTPREIPVVAYGGPPSTMTYVDQPFDYRFGYGPVTIITADYGPPPQWYLPRITSDISRDPSHR